MKFGIEDVTHTEQLPLPRETAGEIARTWFAIGLVLATTIFVAFLAAISGRP